MYTVPNRSNSRLQRIRRIRAKVKGTAIQPRLAVFRSLTHISAQLIDDVSGKTLVAVTDRGLTGTRQEKATAVGKQLAEKAKASKVNHIVFDRAGYKYHGRVAALAQGARDGGLIF